MTAASPVALCAGPEETPNFDRLAHVYRWMEWASFGPFLGFCRNTFLHEMHPCKRALIIGDGDGRFTARLLRENREIEIDALDVSPAMLRALIRRAGADEWRLQSECVDAREWATRDCLPSDPDYDLIVTHFFLDCLTTEEVRILAGKARAAAAPGALWVISEFAIPNNWFGRLVATPLVGALYLAFRWMTGLRTRRLPEHAAPLQECGFHRIERRVWLAGLLISEIWTR